MKHFLFLCLFLFALSVQSCFKDTDDTTRNINNDLVGSWQLTSWSIDGAFDINADGFADTNLLNEIDCANEEILVFDRNGIVTSDSTFNPILKIGQLNGTDGNYIFNIECPEGSIGFSASYTQANGAITIQDKPASLNNNTLTRVFENAIKIYNDDFTQVIETRNLAMVYTKQ